MASNIAKFREYMKLIGNLKNVKRAGWVRKEVDNPESVADHMYRMAMMALALPPDSDLDRDKCIKIALVHDMAETIVGDITPFEDVVKSQKHKQEKDATVHISQLLERDGGNELYNLWMEYESQSTPEAKFVKDLDKLEMCYQAYEYEKSEGNFGRLSEFFDFTKSTRPTFATEIAEEWRKDLVEQREKAMMLATERNSSEMTAGEEGAGGKKRKIEEVDKEEKV